MDDENKTERLILNFRPSEALALKALATENDTTPMRAARTIVRRELAKVEAAANV